MDTFLGYETPLEVSKCCKQVESVSKAGLREIIQFAVMKADDSVGEESVDTFCNKHSIERQGFVDIFVGIQHIIKAAKRRRTEKKVFGADLVKIGFPANYVTDVWKGVTFSLLRTESEGLVVPHLKLLKWRLDVSIASSHLHRHMRPAIHLQFQLSDGTTHTVETSLQEFQRLRYSVASIVHELHDQGKHPAFQIKQKR